ncbi:hypothetical protein PV350_23510 [Streptomyces sp. PA03-6a]|nr:hypothetical protein [Streptomyces sp. PA03-6a]
MQISAVREALAEAARAVQMPAGTRALNCTAYVPDSATVPCLFIADVEVDFNTAMNHAMDRIEFTVRVLVSRADDKSSQEILDGLLSGSGPGSLLAAIEAARGAPDEMALGGLADDLHVLRVQGYRWCEHSGTTYLGAELIIRVIGAS